jgi:NIPSNAP protein
MLVQVRTYKIKPGDMEEFVALWRDHIVPARAAHGFQVLGAWNDVEDGTFAWVVGHEAPDGWDAIEKAYYDSPERQGVPRNPSELMDGAETKVLAPVAF